MKKILSTPSINVRFIPPITSEHSSGRKSHPIYVILTHPRASGTALEYVFRQLEQDGTPMLEVLHQPFLSMLEKGESGFKEVLDRIIKLSKNRPVLVKEVGYILQKHWDSVSHFLLTPQVKILFYIREPAKTIQSLANQRAALRQSCPKVDTIGFEELHKIREFLSSTDKECLVLDSDRFLSDPMKFLKKFTELWGLPFNESCLKWKQVDHEKRKFTSWYATIDRSTGLNGAAPEIKKNENLQPEFAVSLDSWLPKLTSCYTHHLGFYLNLLQGSILASPFHYDEHGIFDTEDNETNFCRFFLIENKGNWFPPKSDPLNSPISKKFNKIGALLDTAKHPFSKLLILDQLSRHLLKLKIIDDAYKTECDKEALKIAEEMVKHNAVTSYPPIYRMFIVNVFIHAGKLNLALEIIKKAYWESSIADPLSLETKTLKSTYEEVLSRAMANGSFNSVSGLNLASADSVPQSVIHELGYPLETYDPFKSLEAVETNPLFLTYLTKITDILGERDHLVVSFSGGVDSTVMIHLLAYLRNKGAVKFVAAVHINMKNRSEADDEARFCAYICQTLDIPFYVREITEVTRNSGAVSSTFYDEYTRDARFKAYCNVAQLISKNINKVLVMLAHHQGDLTENILFNLWAMKGFGHFHSLSGMRPLECIRSVNICRPFLDLPKPRPLARLLKLPWVADPETDHLDSREILRRRVIPKIYKHYPNYTHRLLLLADVEFTHSNLAATAQLLSIKDGQYVTLTPLIDRNSLRKVLEQILTFCGKSIEVLETSKLQIEKFNRFVLNAIMLDSKADQISIKFSDYTLKLAYIDGKLKFSINNLKPPKVKNITSASKKKKTAAPEQKKLYFFGKPDLCKHPCMQHAEEYDIFFKDHALAWYRLHKIDGPDLVYQEIDEMLRLIQLDTFYAIENTPASPGMTIAGQLLKAFNASLKGKGPKICLYISEDLLDIPSLLTCLYFIKHSIHAKPSTRNKQKPSFSVSLSAKLDDDVQDLLIKILHKLNIPILERTDEALRDQDLIFPGDQISLAVEAEHLIFSDAMHHDLKNPVFFSFDSHTLWSFVFSRLVFSDDALKIKASLEALKTKYDTEALNKLTIITPLREIGNILGPIVFIKWRASLLKHLSSIPLSEELETIPDFLVYYYATLFEDKTFSKNNVLKKDKSTP